MSQELLKSGIPIPENPFHGVDPSELQLEELMDSGHLVSESGMSFVMNTKGGLRFMGDVEWRPYTSSDSNFRVESGLLYNSTAYDIVRSGLKDTIGITSTIRSRFMQAEGIDRPTVEDLRLFNMMLVLLPLYVAKRVDEPVDTGEIPDSLLAVRTIAQGLGIITNPTGKIVRPLSKTSEEIYDLIEACGMHTTLEESMSPGDEPASCPASRLLMISAIEEFMYGGPSRDPHPMVDDLNIDTDRLALFATGNYSIRELSAELLLFEQNAIARNSPSKAFNMIKTNLLSRAEHIHETVKISFEDMRQALGITGLAPDLTTQTYLNLFDDYGYVLGPALGLKRVPEPRVNYSKKLRLPGL